MKYGKSTIRRSILMRELKSKETKERVRYITTGGLEVPGNVHVDFESKKKVLTKKIREIV